MPQQLNIINGPSKLQLMLALFDSTSAEPRKVRFALGYGDDRKWSHDALVLVSSVEQEDGSGESWNIKGHWGASNVMIYFSTKRRKGFMSIMD